MKNKQKTYKKLTKNYKIQKLAFFLKENNILEPYFCPKCQKQLFNITLNNKYYCYCTKCYFRTSEI